MPLCHFKVMYNWQRNNYVRNLDKRKRLLIAMDVAFGMEYLHGKNIVHFDLKSDNLLVNLRDPHRPICKVSELTWFLYNLILVHFLSSTCAELFVCSNITLLVNKQNQYKLCLSLWSATLFLYMSTNCMFSSSWLFIRALFSWFLYLPFTENLQAHIEIGLYYYKII